MYKKELKFLRKTTDLPEKELAENTINTVNRIYNESLQKFKEIYGMNL